MKWWHWLILELLIIFGIIAWIYFFPSEFEYDFAKGMIGLVLLCLVKERRNRMSENHIVEQNAGENQIEGGKELSTNKSEGLKFTDSLIGNTPILKDLDFVEELSELLKKHSFGERIKIKDKTIANYLYCELVALNTLVETL